MFKAISLLLLFFVPFKLLSQIFPKEGSGLSYRIIGFSFPQLEGEKNAKLEIAGGYYTNVDSFNHSRSQSIKCTSNKIIAEVPAFGATYTWCIAYPGKRIAPGGLHHFTTLVSPKIDTSTSRLRIICRAERYKDAYVFVDATQTLYDMNGIPVWFLPDTNYLTNTAINTVDIKCSQQKTITFIINGQAKEINYDGNILWSGPNTGEVSGDTSEYYHHEFTKLANGHYMIMGAETIRRKMQGYVPDSDAGPDIEKDSNNIFYRKLRFGTIIEYDQKGKVVWSWKSSAYFERLDSNKLDGDGRRSQGVAAHENSFFFDEKNKIVYVSCRDISRVLKVKYPEGVVLASYGTANTVDSEKVAGALFSGQHSVNISQDGYLYLYNNNILPSEMSRLVMLEESASGDTALKKIWEYTCSLDGLTDNEQQHYNEQFKHWRIKAGGKNSHTKMHFTSGGNVTELPDRSIFASMNGPASKLFIVTRDKKILWSAIPEHKQAADHIWETAPTYRASIIATRKDIEQLIWNVEK